VIAGSGVVFRVFIENPAGTNIKHTFNEKALEPIRTDRVAAKYPFPYGFILQTTSGDGDNVDCFVITDQELRTGAVVSCEAVGMVTQIEDGEVDHNILGICCGEELVLSEEDMGRVQEFSRHVFDHIPGKVVKVGKFMEKGAAERYIGECLD
jgi:inorganic pyrophosphatase